MLYVAVDVGCIECSEETSVLGVFTDKQKAMEVLAEHKKGNKIIGVDNIILNYMKYLI